jgi:hypothetical protein
MTFSGVRAASNSACGISLYSSSGVSRVVFSLHDVSVAVHVARPNGGIYRFKSRLKFDAYFPLSSTKDVDCLL